MSQSDLLYCTELNENFEMEECNMTNNEKIDNCITRIIETVSDNICNAYKNDSMMHCSEIEALAVLIKARATIKPRLNYSDFSDPESSKE